MHSSRIRLLIEGGFLLHWKKVSVSAEVRKPEGNGKMGDNSDANDNESNSGVIGLNIYQLQSAFYLITFGILIAIIALISEKLSFNIIYKYLRKTIKINDRTHFSQIPIKAVCNYKLSFKYKTIQFH